VTGSSFHQTLASISKRASRFYPCFFWVVGWGGWWFWGGFFVCFVGS
jgi:hypothetical protein